MYTPDWLARCWNDFVPTVGLAILENITSDILTYPVLLELLGIRENFNQQFVPRDLIEWISKKLYTCNNHTWQNQLGSMHHFL